MWENQNFGKLSTWDMVATMIMLVMCLTTYMLMSSRFIHIWSHNLILVFELQL
jgi:hypothetical protein